MENGKVMKMAKKSKAKKTGGTQALPTTHPPKRKKGPDLMMKKGKGTKGGGRT